MDSARTDKIRRLEVAIGRVFNDKHSLEAWTCLHAAGARTQDGNKLLAMRGDALLRLIIIEDLMPNGYGREFIQNTLSRVSSNNCLCSVGRRNEIDGLIVRNNSQRHESPSANTVANTVEAILAAVWSDSAEDLDAVREVMKYIGLWPEE